MIKHFDYIIVGCGLAGLAFAETALLQNKKIFVFDNDSQNASKIAAGLYNPVILKRFSEVWDAKNQLAKMLPFYSKLEVKLSEKFIFQKPILRKFFSIEEQNNWFSASDKPNLSSFLSTTLISNQYNGIEAPFQFGEVLQTGFVDTAKLLMHYKSYLIEKEILMFDKFDCNSIVFNKQIIEYKGVTTNHIIFAEGFGMHSNPFFNYLPLDGTKGEVLIIKAPKLNIDVIVNTSVFILPLGNDLFKVGATYNWKDKTNTPTEEGKQELVDRIEEILNCKFEVIAHFAGVRPTVRDRMPIIGTHFKHNNIHILNGLGTRGVMIAPTIAAVLYDNIEFGNPIVKEINIKRFSNKV